MEMALPIMVVGGFFMSYFGVILYFVLTTKKKS